MQKESRKEKYTGRLNLSVPKELLLHSFLSDYIRAFIVDLEKDSYELLFEREEDPVLTEIIRQTDKYSVFNKLTAAFFRSRLLLPGAKWPAAVRTFGICSRCRKASALSFRDAVWTT